MTADGCPSDAVGNIRPTEEDQMIAGFISTALLVIVVAIAVVIGTIVWIIKKVL
jgi:hypothetical protein